MTKKYKNKNNNYLQNTHWAVKYSLDSHIYVELILAK